MHEVHGSWKAVSKCEMRLVYSRATAGITSRPAGVHTLTTPCAAQLSLHDVVCRHGVSKGQDEIVVHLPLDGRAEQQLDELRTTVRRCARAACTWSCVGAARSGGKRTAWGGEGQSGVVASNRPRTALPMAT